MNLIKNAYSSYNLITDEKIANKILKFAKKRLEKNIKSTQKNSIQ